MKKSLIRRLDVLEKTQRCLEAEERSSLRGALTYIWMIVLAYYLGGLQLENDDPFEAHARALGYSSNAHLHESLEGQIESDTYTALPGVPDKKISVQATLDFLNRNREAIRRLFLAYDLNVDQEPPSVLFEAFVKLIDNLPDQWLSWLRDNVCAYCRVKIPAGLNLPRELSSDNFL
jgi:hypothetical protein